MALMLGLGLSVCGGGAAAPAVVAPLLLDLLATSAVRAYSLRKLRAAYAGSAIRVRRDNDNAEQDIGFVAGALDTAALATFVGSNSAYLSKWYDQSGNADDAVQASTSLQPRIRNAGTNETLNSLPVVRFGLATSVVLNSTTPLTTKECLVITATTEAATFSEYSVVVSGSSVEGLLGESGTSHWYTGDGFLSANTNNSGNNTAVFGSVLQQVNANSTSTTLNLSFVQIGLADSDARKWLGWIGEVILFPTLLSSGDRTTAYTNQKTYWGTP
jgi:hypothetical protein